MSQAKVKTSLTNGIEAMILIVLLLSSVSVEYKTFYGSINYGIPSASPIYSTT